MQASERRKYMRERVEVVVREAEVVEEGGVEEGAVADRVKDCLFAEWERRYMYPPKTRSSTPWNI